MFSDIRALFCKWTPWESQTLSCLEQSLAARHKPILRAQLDAVSKIQRILGWREIDLYVMKFGRVCWDGVPCFEDMGEFRLAKARTMSDGFTIESELTCVRGHLFSIESDVPVKPVAFQHDITVQIYDIDSRFA
jgi:hypothetical protein